MRYVTALFSTFFLFANLVCASPTNPVVGAEYTGLMTPQATTAVGKQVEVIEFFMYHCPACNMLDPALMEWVKKQGSNIQFKRIHVAHTGAKDVAAHLFLTLEAMQKENELHTKVLRTWHVEHSSLTTDEDNIGWAMKNGIDKEKFLEIYNSFSVISKLRNLPAIASNYSVDSTPTIIVDGRYLTSMALVQKSNSEISRDNLVGATLQVVDALVTKARAEKK